MRAHIAALPRSVRDAFLVRELPRAGPDTAARLQEALRLAPAGPANPIARMGVRTDDFTIALAAAQSPEAVAALGEYAAAAASGKPSASAYARGSHNLDLLIKTNLLLRIDRDITLIADGASLDAIIADAQRSGLIQDARELAAYLERFYDERNFPEFPAGNAFLAPGQYFAMGDNRYNSLDFRFSERPELRALDPADPTSVMYQSLLAPFPLELKFIEGYAVFRVWPLTRMGVIR